MTLFAWQGERNPACNKPAATAIPRDSSWRGHHASWKFLESHKNVFIFFNPLENAEKLFWSWIIPEIRVDGS